MADISNETVTVVSWDWKDQPDLSKIGEAVRRISGGRCDLRAPETDGDFYAVVIAGHVMADQDEAQRLFEATYYEDEESQ